jgi:hypothetical protein
VPTLFKFLKATVALLRFVKRGDSRFKTGTHDLHKFAASRRPICICVEVFFLHRAAPFIECISYYLHGSRFRRELSTWIYVFFNNFETDKILQLLADARLQMVSMQLTNKFCGVQLRILANHVNQFTLRAIVAF